MAKDQLRENALTAIDGVRWIPASGRNRIRGMVADRPDWCVSRQRSWGTPMAIFVHKGTGKPLIDQGVFDSIISAIQRDGADVWFDRPKEKFLPSQYNPEDYEVVTDILDVWFDAGSTQAFCLQKDPDLRWPADLYLEGSDQHRGWFQSSLMVSVGNTGQSPYRQVLTHGFLVDEQGRKMSKSTGNIVPVYDLVKTYGADILRLTALSMDYQSDVRFGTNILKQQEDVYRRFRNTLRYLLGSLKGFSGETLVPYESLPDLEKWVLGQVKRLDDERKRLFEDYEIHQWISSVHHFCNTELSAFYFDIRKDTLYCDGENSPVRQSVLTVLHILFEAITRWLAPVLVFTAEEAWLERHGATEDQSVHLQTFFDCPTHWASEALLEKFNRIKEVRSVVTGALEQARAQGIIGSSLQGHPVVTSQPSWMTGLEDVNWEEICITSGFSLTVSDVLPEDGYSLPHVQGVVVQISIASGEKCQRCWKITPHRGKNHEDLCPRCDEVVTHQGRE